MSTPTLHDDRVDKMRMSVMHRIDQDVTRRGRRARAVIGLSAASVLVVGLGGYAVSSIDGSDRVSGISDSSSGGSSAADAPVPERADAGSSDASGGSSLENGKQVAPDADRQVITTGTIRATVARPSSIAQQLSTWVESVGGRIDNRSENGSGDDAAASLTVRVPSDQVTATIDRLKAYGTVDDVSLQNSDVTAAAKDLDARIDALRVSIDRLEAIMAGAGSSKEVIQAEDALTQRQEQLESLEAERKGIADQVSLSTLSIDLSQKATAGSVEPGGFTGGLRDGWNGLVSTVNNVVQVAGVLLPWAAVGLVLVLGAWLVGRRRGSWN